MTLTPHRRYDDTESEGGISHNQRHINEEARITKLESRDIWILLLLIVNTMLTAGDVITKIGPIVHTFASVRW